MAPNLVDVYEGSVRLYLDTSFPGRIWLIAHALRDIRNRLPTAVAGKVTSSRAEYSELAEAVAAAWREDGLSDDGLIPMTAAEEPPDSGPIRFEVSGSLLRSVGQLVVEHREVGERKLRSARRLFEAATSAPVLDHAARAWVSSTAKIERFAHVRDKPLTLGDLARFESAYRECEEALLALANRSFENMDELDELLAIANG